MDNGDFVLAPTAGWETRLIQAYGAAAITIRYLVSPMQPPEQAHSSPNFLLTAPQLRALATSLLEAAQRIESGGAEGSGLPKH